MNELEWLAERRPDNDPPDDLGTARARAALLTHAVHEGRGDRRRTRRRVELLSLATVVAVAIVVATSALSGGDGTLSRLSPAPPPAEALVRLSHKIQQAPPPPGDAALVHRVHTFPDASKNFEWWDLYEDNGNYYNGRTRDELTLNASETGDDSADSFSKREITAALTAVTDTAKGRTLMMNANWANGKPPSEAENQASAKVQEKIRKLKKGPGPAPTPASRQTLDDNRIWIGAMDALVSGVGRADVRAGVMNILAGLSHVHSKPVGATVEITNTDFSNHYQETLTVDAQTGVLEKMTGGVAGQTPDVVVTYDIKRVQAKDVL